MENTFLRVINHLGCDRTKYRDQRDQLEETHRLRVKNMIKHWEDAEKRYNLLKSSDEGQAAAAIESECTERPSEHLLHCLRPLTHSTSPLLLLLPLKSAIQITKRNCDWVVV